MYSSKRSINNTACGNLGSMLRRSAAVLAVLIMTAATAWAENKPVLNIESIEGYIWGLEITGWAYDPDAPGEEIEIYINIYPDSELQNGTVSLKTKTDVERNDINSQFNLTGKHGINAAFYIGAGNLTEGSYHIKIYALDKSGDDGFVEYNSSSIVVGKNAAPKFNGNRLELNSKTMAVKVGDGCVITGTGGDNTCIVIEDGATITLSDVDITSYKYDDWINPVGVKCLGDATIILDKGTTNYLRGGYKSDPCIQVGPKNTTLTIRGYGSLVARSFGHGSCIGPYEKEECGNIIIESGTLDLETLIQSDGYNLTGYAACIGSSGDGGSCGNITISGGNIHAKSHFGAAAIGSGRGGSCGNINITGGTIYAESTSSQGGPAIGGGLDGSCGNISISGITSVSAKKYNDKAPYCIGPGGGSSTCGTLTLWGQVSDYPVGQYYLRPEVFAPTNIPFTVSFNANEGQGYMADQNFYSNTPQALTAKGFSYPDKDFKCWSTKADGSGQDFYNGEIVTNLGDVTLYAQWDNRDYVVSFDANGGTGTMDDQPFFIDMTQALNANTFTLEGYDFASWNTEPNGSGDSYTDKQPVSDPGQVTLYAQWQVHTYNINYIMDGGTNGSGNPTTYTIESDAIKLAVPTRYGFTFAGWTWEGQATPTTSVTITQGSTGDIQFTAHWKATTITLTPEFGSYTLSDGHTLTGIGGADTHINIADGATVTLSDVDITNILDETDHPWAGITCEGNATIILEGNNAVKGGLGQYPGIFVPESKTLTIRGSGSLSTSSNGYAPGIGATYSTSCGNIVIDGGTITATGGQCSAGIGGNQYGSCGNITITEDVTSVTATHGRNCINAIGAGINSSCGTVTIGVLETGNIVRNSFTYNPSESIVCTVTFDANGGMGTMENQTIVSNLPCTLNASTFTREDYKFIGWTTEPDGSGTSYADRQNAQVIATATNVTLYALWGENISLMSGTGYLKLIDGQTITGTSGSDSHVVIADGATVTLCDVNITAIANDDSHMWAGISCEGDATIILEGVNSVRGGHRYYPGIYVPEGKTLTIKGNGTLNASSNGTSAGIGGGYNISCGNIIIKDGIINATGVAASAGIGGGNGATCGDITITGGTITAIGEDKGIGIGGIKQCGNIIITGGIINATGNNYNPGIGAHHSCGNITITDGVKSITAIKGINAANCIGIEQGNGTIGAITIAPQLIDVTKGNTRTITHPELVIVDTEDNTEAIGSKNRNTCGVLLKDRILFKDGNWNTLCLPFDVNDLDGTPLEGAVIKELNGTTSSLTDGTLTLNFTDATGIEAGKPYIVKWDYTPAFTISTDADWETFACNVNDGTEDYTNKMVKLAADINASAMVGTSDHPFRGTFNGDGHTLTLNISDTENQGTAPFRYISGATIMNVKTVGTVTGNLHCAGLVGFAKSGTDSIKNCVVAADIVCSGGSHSHCGGILGHSLSSNTIISDCLFSGSISGSTTATGIIHGWGDSGKHTIINCYANGIYSDGEPDLMKGGGKNTATNCYKNVETGTLGTYTTATGDDLVSLLGSGWKNDGGNVVPIKFANDIVNLAFIGVTIDTNAGTSVAFSGGQFMGTYSPFASTSGLLFDAHNQNNGACHAVLSIDESLFGGLTFNGWFTDAGYNSPATTIPFADDGTVTLYAKLSDGTTSITFAKEGYSTYYNGLVDAVLPTGMKARIVTAKADGQSLTYETVADGDLNAVGSAIVPAGTAVMLQVAPANTSQSIDLTLTVPTAAAISQDNLLHGSDVATTTTGGDLFYKLSYNTSGQNIGWYWGAQDGGAFTSGAHKAWLALPSSAQHAALRSIGLPEFNEGTTDVLLIPYPAQAEQPDAWYDMFGRKLDSAPAIQGLYIHNGKTISIK